MLCEFLSTRVFTYIVEDDVFSKGKECPVSSQPTVPEILCRRRCR